MLMLKKQLPAASTSKLPEVASFCQDKWQFLYLAIAQMGLFINKNGLPVCMSLFPGNMSDTLTLQPVLIAVADKGLNSAKSIDFICQNGDAYVVSQTLRESKGKRYQKALFDESGWVWNADRMEK